MLALILSIIVITSIHSETIKDDPVSPEEILVRLSRIEDKANFLFHCSERTNEALSFAIEESVITVNNLKELLPQSFEIKSKDILSNYDLFSFDSDQPLLDSAIVIELYSDEFETTPNNYPFSHIVFVKENGLWKFDWSFTFRLYYELKSRNTQ